jgi:hypothetical protein
MSAWIKSRSVGATLTFDTGPRVPSSYSVWVPEEHRVPRRTRRVTPIGQASSGGTLATLAEPEFSIDSVLPIVRTQRSTEWFQGPVAELPKRRPHISPLLLGLVAEDE